ncbi:MAG: YCF48-related protein [Gammaproteobacteria bacterium]|nr:YCF48-related protein [Gammaproteobacteria bacterium]
MIHHQSAHYAVVLLAFASLAGCESPLVLDRVEAQRAQPTQRSDRLQAIASNGETVVTVGSAGVVLSTPLADKKWQRQILDGQPFLMDVDTCPDGRFVALAAEQQVWIGDATGQNWELRALDTFEMPQAITCDPQGRLWVVASFSTIFRSDDDGQSWSETSMDEDLHYNSIQFVDADHAFMTGEFGVIVRSTDGGETWENLDPLPDEFYPQAAFFADTQNGWIVGLTGTVWHTTDGGETWSREKTDTDAPLYGMAYANGQLYAVGAYGTVLKRDGTGNWQSIDHGQPIRFYLRGSLILPAGTLLTAGGAGALFELNV